MGKLVLIPAVTLACMMAMTTWAKTSSSSFYFFQHNQKPKVRFDSIWINYNTWQGGMKGMLIHLKFTAYNMKGLECEIGVYFEFDDEWPWTDKNKKFSK